MANVDRRHSILVAQRFCAAASERVDITTSTGASARRAVLARDLVAAALLHDVGKLESGLGTTIPRRGDRRRTPRSSIPPLPRPRATRPRARWAAGSTPVTLELLAGEGPYADALRAADDI